MRWVDKRGGATMKNVFLKVYFDGFRQSSRFNFCLSKQRWFYVFGVFVDSIKGAGVEGGTPDKRISEGLFSGFWTKIVF